jgi:hypothetical protein
MAKVKLQVWGYRCERCGHEWVPRGDEPPRICPSCKSPYFDRMRRTDNPLVPLLRDIAQTPDVFLISVQTTRTDDGPPVDNYRPAQILSGEFKLSKMSEGAVRIKVWGYLASKKITEEDVIEDVNRLRKFEGLEPLPDGFVCEKVDVRQPVPSYRLSLSILPVAVPHTSQ